MTIISSNSPNHPMLLRLKEELHKDPADFENKKKLYYVAAVISGLVAAAFFLSFIPLQKMILPFWLSLSGTVITQSIAGLLFKRTNKMLQRAKEAGEAANRLREMQNFYKIYQDTSLSDPEKIIKPYAAVAEKEYAEAEARLQELITNVSSPESRLGDVIQLQHEVLLLKIDVCFKVALLDGVAAGNFNCLIEKKDLFVISDQDLSKRHQIQGLNIIINNKFTEEPLLCFKNTFDVLFGSSTNLIDDYPEKLSYNTVAKKRPEDLVNHISTFIDRPLNLLI